MHFDNACAYLIPKLEKDLPSHLTYHNAQHTKNVIHAAQQLAKAEMLSHHETTILQTAALFHDAGFLEGYDNHEELSCKIAKETLPGFGYREEDIAEVCRLIMATRFQQKPTDNLEAILCDADLSYLGTEEYFSTAESLFVELQKVGKLKTWEEWQKLQLKFLEAHQYYSRSAKKMYTAVKSHNFLLFKSGVRKTEDSRSRRMRFLMDFGLITIGVVAATFGLKCFLLPNHFFDGGITGVALILDRAFGWPLSLTTFLLNLPFIVAGYFTVSKSFAVKAFIGVSMLSLFLLFTDEINILAKKTSTAQQTPAKSQSTEAKSHGKDSEESNGAVDNVLVAFFGGFFIGIGSGLAIKGGAVLDGTEVLALYLQRLTNFTIAEIILAINIVIFSAAAYVENLTAAFYSILTYIVASKTIVYVVEGFEAYTGVTIISGQSEVLKSRLVNELRRSITVYKGERGYLPGNFGNATDCDILFTVVSRLELRKLKNLVYESDPNAFVFANTISETSGGILKLRGGH